MPVLPDDLLRCLANIAVQPFRFSVIWEDQMAEAQLAILASEETDHTLLIKVGQNAVVEFVRRWWGRRGQERPAYSLDEYPLWGKPDLFELADRNIDYLSTEDLWPLVELQIWARQVWARLCQISTPQEKEVLWRWIWLGQTQQEMADGMNRHINRIYQLQVSSIARYRKLEGIPKPESKTGATHRWHSPERWVERGKKRAAADAARRKGRHDASRNDPKSGPPVERGPG